jgi:DNA ligase (NAD+)
MSLPDHIAQKIHALRAALREHNYKYYVLAEPSISDLEFDQQLKALQDLEQAYPEALPHLNMSFQC